MLVLKCNLCGSNLRIVKDDQLIFACTNPECEGSEESGGYIPMDCLDEEYFVEVDDTDLGEE